MACLGAAQGAIDAGLAAIDATKAGYAAKLQELRDLDPSDFQSRVDFEAAREALTSEMVGLLGAYVNSVGVLRTAGELLDKVSGLEVDSLADAQGLALNALLGLIPGAPDVLEPINAVVAAAKGLQC